MPYNNLIREKNQNIEKSAAQNNEFYTLLRNITILNEQLA